jgi:hypothetical protein
MVAVAQLVTVAKDAERYQDATVKRKTKRAA